MNDWNNIQQMWNSHEKQLEQQWNFNAELLKRINLDKAKRKTNQMIWVKAITLAFYSLACAWLLHFSITHLAEPTLTVPGFVLAFWTLLVCFASMRELQLIVSLDYSAPLPKLQNQLLQLRTNIIHFFRLGAWALPLHLAFSSVIANVFFGIDLLQVTEVNWLIAQIVFSCLVLLPLAIWIHTKLVATNATKKWMHILLRGNGNQITEALELLAEVEELKEN